MKIAISPRKSSPSPKVKTPTIRRAKSVNIKRILVPLDGSDAALKALTYAASLAELFGARIDTIRVNEPTIYPDALAIPQYSFEQNELVAKLARQQSQEAGERLIPDAVEWRNCVMTGNPYVEIVNYARKENIDLLIVTTHGHTGLKHFLMGSNAEKIIRHAPCPVLVVRDLEHDFV